MDVLKYEENGVGLLKYVLVMGGVIQIPDNEHLIFC
jgi:hypothetical protein